MYVKSLLLPAAATGRAIRSRGFVFITGTARVQRFQAHHVLFSSGFSGQSPSASEHPFSCFNLAAPVYAQDPFPPRRSRVLSLKTMSTNGGNVGQSPSSVVEFKTAKDVVDFWFGDLERFASDKEYASSVAGKWWGFGPTDEVFIASQMASKELIRKAASGELQGGSWEGPQGALAKIIVLDQFPRTVYRGTAQAFATDEIAATLALEVIANGWDKLGVNYTFAQRNFVYLPLMHSERLEAQEECVERCKVLVDEKAIVEGKADLGVYSMAKDHYDVISKFGRFPHRNSALGRTCTPDEEEWLSSDDIPGWAKSQEASASSA